MKLTEYKASVIQRIEDIIHNNSGANRHSVGSFINLDGLQLAQIDS